MIITKENLIKLGWKYVRRVGKNIEIWERDEQMRGIQKLLWNRITLRVYMI